MEVRRAAVRAAAAKARATFEVEYPKIIDWFDTYDPLYLLSFFAYYFLSAPQGVDKEAIEGKLAFASFHIELLQAFALMRFTWRHTTSSCRTVRPLEELAEKGH